jgi:uncharacterized protein YceK
MKADARLMRFKGKASLILVVLVLSVLFGGCPTPESLAGGGSGCRRPYAGLSAVDRPETSRLSCAAINNLTSGTPGEPESYLTTDDSPRHLLWKCKFYGAAAQRVLLRCAHHNRQFSIVKSGTP